MSGKSKRGKSSSVTLRTPQPSERKMSEIKMVMEEKRKASFTLFSQSKAVCMHRGDKISGWRSYTHGKRSWNTWTTPSAVLPWGEYRCFSVDHLFLLSSLWSYLVWQSRYFRNIMPEILTWSAICSTVLVQESERDHSSEEKGGTSKSLIPTSAQFYPLEYNSQDCFSRVYEIRTTEFSGRPQNC